MKIRAELEIKMAQARSSYDTAFHDARFVRSEKVIEAETALNNIYAQISEFEDSDREVVVATSMVVCYADGSLENVDTSNMVIERRGTVFMLFSQGSSECLQFSEGLGCVDSVHFNTDTRDNAE